MKKIARLSMLFILLIPQSVFAKDPFHWQAINDPFHWEFINVEVDLQENGDLLIKETQQYVFDAAYSAQRYRWIPLGGIDHIADISVTEDGKPLNINTYIENNRQWIKWTKAVIPPDRHLFVLSYRVIGGLAIHKDGDQLHWQAIFKDHAAPINKAKVTVKLPAILAGHIQAYQGATAQRLNDRTVEFVRTQPLPAGQGLDISVTFSHGVLKVQEAQKPVDKSENKSNTTLDIFLALITLMIYSAAGMALIIMLFGKNMNKNRCGDYRDYYDGDGG